MEPREREKLLQDARSMADSAIRGDTATGTFWTLQSIAYTLVVIADVLCESVQRGGDDTGA